MPRDAIKEGYEKLKVDKLAYAKDLNMKGATWLLVGAIALHEVPDGWFKFFGSLLLFASFLYDVLLNGMLYRVKDAKARLKLLNKKMESISPDDHELHALAQNVNDEMGTIKPLIRTSLYLACFIYFATIFIAQLKWVFS